MKFLFAVILWCAFGVPIVAAQEISSPDSKPQPKSRVYVTAWGMTLANDGSGVYNDLGRLVLGPLMDDISFEIIPYRRANRTFNSDKSSCHYPSTLNYLTETQIVTDTSDLIESAFFMRTMAHIFARPGHEAPTDKEGTRGKTIAYPMGAEVPALLDGYNASFIPVTDETAKAAMLLSGRVDLMIAYMPDAKFVFDALGAAVAPYDPGFTINDDNAAIVCHRTPATEALIAQVNARVKMLKENGALARFLTANGIDPAYYMPREK